MNVLDLFCGAGGLSLGFSQAGFTTIGAVDKDESAVQTINHNHDQPIGHTLDLTEETPTDLLDTLAITKNEIDVVVGGPPCQGFSTANRERYEDDERNNLVFVFADFVTEYSPKAFVMENVPGILTIGDGTLPETLLKYYESNGYTVQYQKINAANYEVPQKRERVLFIGIRNDIAETLTFPDPLITDESQYTTTREAFESLPNLDAGEESSQYANHKAPNHQQKTVTRLQKTGQGEPVPYDNWSQKTRLHPEHPSPTILAGKRPNFHRVHYEDDRGLTVRERARLQSFPDEYEFKGPITDQRRQTGNAVPPKLAYEIATHLKNTYL